MVIKYFLEVMLKIKISNNITIENPPLTCVKACKTALTIDNPAYWKNKRMGIKVWDSMRTFKYYKIDTDGSICLPRGFRMRLLKWLDAVGIEYEVEEDLISKEL